MNMQSGLRIAEHVHWRRFDTDMVVLDLQNSQYFGLNELGADLFERIGQGQEIPAIVADLLEIYEVGRAQLESDLGEILAELLRRGLLSTDTT